VALTANEKEFVVWMVAMKITIAYCTMIKAQGHNLHFILKGRTLQR